MKIIQDIDYSFQDFPGKYSMVLFFKGCNLDCSFCFNKEVVNGAGRYSLKDIRQKLEKSRKVMNGNVGVVFSGGEPTVAQGFRETVAALPGEKAIHTNGLVVPDEAEIFERATISLKPSTEIQMDYNKYLDKINMAIEAYRNPIIVWVDGPWEDPTIALNSLEGDFLFQKQTYQEVIDEDG